MLPPLAIFAAPSRAESLPREHATRPGFGGPPAVHHEGPIRQHEFDALALLERLEERGFVAHAIAVERFAARALS